MVSARDTATDPAFPSGTRPKLRHPVASQTGAIRKHTHTMQLKQLLNDDDAVSPVIGVILMVAITVILAAVIGTFVLGLGDQVQDTAPNTNMEFDYDGAESLEITQTGGNGIEYTKLGISVDGTTYAHQDTNEFESSATKDDSTHSITDEWFTESGKTSAGDSVNLSTDPDDGGAIDVGGVSSVEEVRVVWRSGDQSSTIQTWTN